MSTSYYTTAPQPICESVEVGVPTQFWLAVRELSDAHETCTCIGPFPSPKDASDVFDDVYGDTVTPAYASVTTKAIPPDEIRTFDPMRAVKVCINTAAERLV